MSDDMELLRQKALLREVDEEVRNDELKAAWNKYKIYIIGAICLILLVAVGIEGFKYHSQQVIFNDAVEYTKADVLINEENYAEAIALFEQIAKNNNSGYAHLALLRTVPLLEKEGKKAQAVARLYEIKDKAAVPVPFKNAATIALAFRLIDDKTADKSEIKQMLAPLSTGTSSWSVIARDMLNLLDAKE